jgi:hypothetical protein
MPRIAPQEALFTGFSPRAQRSRSPAATSINHSTPPRGDLPRRLNDDANPIHYAQTSGSYGGGHGGADIGLTRP